MTPRATLVRDRDATLISSFSFGASTALVLGIALPRVIGFVYGMTIDIPPGFTAMLSRVGRLLAAIMSLMISSSG